MPVTRRALLSSLSVLALSNCSMTSADRRIGALLGRYQGDVPGAAVAIIRDGAATHHVRGYSNLETRDPITPDNNFRLASIT